MILNFVFLGIQMGSTKKVQLEEKQHSHQKVKENILIKKIIVFLQYDAYLINFSNGLIYDWSIYIYMSRIIIFYDLFGLPT